MRILVTGATGVIGRDVVARLVGEDVHTVGRGDAGRTGHHRADLASSDDANGVVRAVAPAAILHLAGGRRADVRALYRDNVVATANLVDAAARLDDPPIIVVAGSAAEYGEPPRDDPIPEDAPLAPMTPYGRAKAAATLVAQTLAASRVTLTIARLFNVVSPELPDSTPLGNIRRQLLAGSGSRRRVRCGRLDIVRDFVPSSFVAEALVRLVRTPHAGVVNVCSGVGIQLADIVAAAADEGGFAVDVELDPELAAIPAVERVVGDPATLRALGLHCAATPRALARELLAGA